MKHWILFTIVCIGFDFSFYAQENARVEVDTSIVDPRYREDQFYASITYNLLANKPESISQTGFSSGFHLGFIRDMPITERRNIAIGLGIGLSTNSYNQNLRIVETSPQNYSYSVLDDSETPFSKNKFTTYILEFPLEFRWRTSTTTEYDFWRIYSGFKLGYIFYNTAKYEGSPNNDITNNIKDINRLQYGLQLSVGYDTINFYVYYTLNEIFDDSAELESNPIDMNAFKIGLIFYIL